MGRRKAVRRRGCCASPSNRSKDVLKSEESATEEPLDHEVPGADAAFAYDPSNPESNVSSGERRHHLETALLQVSPKYREVLILRDIEELSYEENPRDPQLPVTDAEDPRRAGARDVARRHPARRRHVVSPGPSHAIIEVAEEPIVDLAQLREIAPPRPPLVGARHDPRRRSRDADGVGSGSGAPCASSCTISPAGIVALAALVGAGLALFVAR